MMLQISALSFPLTPAIREHVESRVQSALGRLGVTPAQVSVRLLDVNGLRGGVDKQCRVSVKMRHSVPAVAESTSDDLYQAVDKAASRVKAILRRHRARQRTAHRGLARHADYAVA